MFSLTGPHTSGIQNQAQHCKSTDDRHCQLGSGHCCKCHSDSSSCAGFGRCMFCILNLDQYCKTMPGNHFPRGSTHWHKLSSALLHGNWSRSGSNLCCKLRSGPSSSSQLGQRRSGNLNQNRRCKSMTDTWFRSGSSQGCKICIGRYLSEEIGLGRLHSLIHYQ